MARTSKKHYRDACYLALAEGFANAKVLAAKGGEHGRLVLITPSGKTQELPISRGKPGSWRWIANLKTDLRRLRRADDHDTGTVRPTRPPPAPTTSS